MAIAEIDGIETFRFVLVRTFKTKKIIETLELNKPQFEETAKFGHFGNNFKWDGNE